MRLLLAVAGNDERHVRHLAKVAVEGFNQFGKSFPRIQVAHANKGKAAFLVRMAVAGAEGGDVYKVGNHGGLVGAGQVRRQVLPEQRTYTDHLAGLAVGSP